MEAAFLKLLNMSISASWLILVVIILRFVLKNSSKSLRCVLWGLVAFRLLCPFSFESILSLIPSAETVPQDIIFSQTPVIQSGIPVVNQTVNPVITNTFAPTPENLADNSVNPLQSLVFLLSIIWIMGMISMGLYAIISYVRIYRKIREACEFEQSVWICDHITTPFILGIVRPQIYLPSQLNETQIKHIILHEKAHLKRYDYWWKPLGFLLLSVYWFNPVLWIAYILFCRDIEFACDESVVKDMSLFDRKAYSSTLLDCSVSQHFVMVSPLAFGETGIKSRIKSILNYKKPALGISIIAIAACMVVGVCFLTNPTEHKNLFNWNFTKEIKDVNSIVNNFFESNYQYKKTCTYYIKEGIYNQYTEEGTVMNSPSYAEIVNITDYIIQPRISSAYYYETNSGINAYYSAYDGVPTSSVYQPYFKSSEYVEQNRPYGYGYDLEFEFDREEEINGTIVKVYKTKFIYNMAEAYRLTNEKAVAEIRQEYYIDEKNGKVLRIDTDLIEVTKMHNQIMEKDSLSTEQLNTTARDEVLEILDSGEHISFDIPVGMSEDYAKTLSRLSTVEVIQEILTKSQISVLNNYTSDGITAKKYMEEFESYHELMNRSDCLEALAKVYKEIQIQKSKEESLNEFSQAKHIEFLIAIKFYELAQNESDNDYDEVFNEIYKTAIEKQKLRNKQKEDLYINIVDNGFCYFYYSLPIDGYESSYLSKLVTAIREL